MANLVYLDHALQFQRGPRPPSRECPAATRMTGEDLDGLAKFAVGVTNVSHAVSLLQLAGNRSV